MSLNDDHKRRRVSKWESVKDGWASTWWVERWGPRVALLGAVAIAVFLFGLVYIIQNVLGWPSPANL